MLALFAFWTLSPAAHAAGEPLPMWEIRSTASRGTVYLLGSIHVCRETCLQFPESILRRFRGSQALALELDPTRPELMSQMMAAMALPPGQTLSSKLSPSQSRKLQSVVGDLGLPMQFLDGMRPIMAATMISALAAQKQGLTMQDGIDVWFLQQAQSNNKPVRELETIERQLAALTSGSESDQITALQETLDMIEKRRFGPYLEEMVQAWQRGNLPKISQLMREGEGQSKGLEQELFNKRNAEMAEKISLWLSRGEEVFVVIGAGHIAGKGNVADLLARKGFSVRQVNNGE
ncbi:MAG: TraB/GumN family protein [Rhodocyclales bacterium]|nr:TraB/GumN family protein [Rhodocyclales bacterium]